MTGDIKLANAAPRGRVPTVQILVLETDVLASFDWADLIGARGYCVVDPFTSCEAALQWLATNTPQVAVVDWDLGEASCREVARVLQDRAVPLVVVSSAHKPTELLAGLTPVNWLRKPVPAEVVLARTQAVCRL
jgi:DNA-binding response OmpR family regulator